MLPAFFTRSQGLRKLYCGLFTPMLERHGLTQLEVDILLFLANNPAYDTARDIVEKRHLAKSHVSVGVDALAARGMLDRRKREGNRKTIHLCRRRAGGGGGPGRPAAVRGDASPGVFRGGAAGAVPPSGQGERERGPGADGVASSQLP